MRQRAAPRSTAQCDRAARELGKVRGGVALQVLDLTGKFGRDFRPSSAVVSFAVWLCAARKASTLDLRARISSAIFCAVGGGFNA
jgi:hypothetical protein